MNSINPKTYMIAAGVGVFIGVGFVYTQNAALSSAKSALAVESKDYKPRDQVAKELQDTQQKLASEQAETAHLEANVSAASYVPSLLMDLANFGKAHGLLITGVRPEQDSTPKKADDKKPYDELKIQVTGRGTYAQVEDFVASLTKFPKIVAMRMLSIQPVSHSPADQGPDPHWVTVTAEIKAFVFKSGTTDASDSTDGSQKVALNATGDTQHAG